MYLEKLKIFGFKSFAKPATFEFMPGITSIVGPNGCGKSNVVDAIRWVLGEQRAGTLRSDRMENVIFNGSKTQKPMGMAEVSLVIQNTRNVLPITYSEVVITRRLFRSGESQYLLNNTACRLKDITDLLMDTGLAPDAYSVIELSMVESILNGKPEDRRRLFEEAVGITKYKQRRKLTLKKLEATEQDMLRLSDIIGEVRSKVNSLQRQVRRAQRYQELAKNLRDLEIQMATQRYSQIYEELIPIGQQFEEFSRQRESLTSQISFKEAESEALQANLLQLEQQHRDLQQQLNQITTTLHKREEEILLQRERLKSLAENKTRLMGEIEQLKQRIVAGKEHLVQLEQQMATNAAAIQTTRQLHAEQQQALTELEQTSATSRAEIRDLEKKVFNQLQTLSDAQRQLERLNTQLDHIKQREKNLLAEKNDLLQKIETYEKHLRQLQHTESREQAQLEALLEEQTTVELEAERLVEQIQQQRDALTQKANQADSVEQRIGFMTQLLESYADYPEGVQYLLRQQGKSDHFLSTVADAIAVDEKHRQAIEAALGETASYLLLQDESVAYLAISDLTRLQQGVVTFVPLQQLAGSKAHIDLPQQTGIIGWADDLVRCDERYLAAIRLLLGSYLVVEDQTIAKQLLPKLSHHGINLITLGGAVLYHWGGIKGGRKGAGSVSLIGRQESLKQLRQQHDQLQIEISASENKLRELEQQRLEKMRRKSELAQQLKLGQEKLSGTRSELSQLQFRLSQSRERIQLIENEHQQLQQEAENILTPQRELTEIINQHSTHHASLNELLRQQQQIIEEHDRQRQEQATKVSALNLKIAEQSAIEQNLAREFQQIQQSIAEHESAIQERSKNLLQIDEQSAQMRSNMEELSEVLADDYSAKEAAELKVAELGQQIRDQRGNVDEKTRVINQLRRDREANADKLHQIELKKSELRIQADNLYRRMLEEYDVELQRVAIDPQFDTQATEQQIDGLRQQIKNLGPVNLLALKEFEAEKERLDFLEKQQSDLIAAEQDLKDTISQLNQTAQDRFDSSFQEIRQNFIKVFKNFFPEGEADLVIVPDEDPLESTIEIKANPKSKKMESLTLLSAGEKALTAISLLFGIYLVKPSPICILDEVDAPLDDNNIKRFLKTIREFAESTQFIIVTHNKLTMKSADCLFGITMEESGVSKIVSVKLE
ncbi:MAG: chromosome segregation protein SMC [candidate division KSB1 bacterium]|nr:chromosome segregation protein SMC [candidate division KSB1 bacterium]